MRKLRAPGQEADSPFLMARPNPARLKIVPTPEEFAAWCAHPVTEWVANVFEIKAAECQRTWSEQSWRSGQPPDPELLIELRTRADNYRAFLDSTYKDYLNASSEK